MEATSRHWHSQSFEQYLEFDPVTQEYVVKEELLPNINQRDLNNIDALKLAFNKVTQLRNDELVETVINKNGKQEIIFMPRREYLEKERQQKEAEEKTRIDNINKQVDESRTFMNQGMYSQGIL